MAVAGAERAPSLRDVMAVLRRRRWIALLLLLVAPVVALAFSSRQEEMYESSTQLLLSRQNLGIALLGVPDLQGSATDSERSMQTQLQVAESPIVAARTAAQLKLPGRTAGIIADRTTAEGSADSDLLTISAQDGRPDVARRMADVYASEYLDYRRRLDTDAVSDARRDVQAQIHGLERRGEQTSELARRLIGKSQQLRTLETLQSANATVAAPAGAATQIAPATGRALALSLVVGVVFALAGAFLAEALDTRLRSPEDIASILGRRWLGSLPRPMRSHRGRSPLVLQADPLGADAEAFRMLRTNIDLVRLGLSSDRLLVTSAAEQEGKSTTVANLGLAWALGGRRVIVVDLDLRGPSLHRYLDVRESPGIADVALGTVTLDEALRAASLPENALVPEGNGSLHVLTAGVATPDPGDFVGSTRVGEILAELKDRADIVLVDTPPMLRAGDAAAICRHIDAVIAVVRADTARRGPMRELRNALDLVPAPTFGFVLTGHGQRKLYDARAGHGVTRALRAGRRGTPRADPATLGRR